MELQIDVRQVVAVIGQFQQVFKICGFRLGVLEETVLLRVLATDANIIKVLLVEHIIQKQSLPLEVVTILYVLVVFTDVVLESVMVA